MATEGSPFAHLIDCLEDGQMLFSLINGDWGWLWYGREEGDAGFSSRNPDYSGPADAEIEYRLENGQHDFYPASWALPVAEVRRAMDYFAGEGRPPTFITWHNDSGDGTTID